MTLRRGKCANCGHIGEYHNAFGTMPCGGCDCNRFRVVIPEPVKAKPKEPVLKGEWRFFLADLKAVEESANEVLRQCNFLRRNGLEDHSRFSFIEMASRKATNSAERGRRRSKQRFAGEVS
jgi:hypothetical protein